MHIKKKKKEPGLSKYFQFSVFLKLARFEKKIRGGGGGARVVDKNSNSIKNKFGIDQIHTLQTVCTVSEVNSTMFKHVFLVFFSLFRTV